MHGSPLEFRSGAIKYLSEVGDESVDAVRNERVELASDKLAYAAAPRTLRIVEKLLSRKGRGPIHSMYNKSELQL